MKHLLVLTGIEDEGSPIFEIDCPGDHPGGRCSYPLDGYYGCWVKEDFSAVGREMIAGRATGNGPWPFDVDVSGSGEDYEMYLVLTPGPPDPPPGLIPRGVILVA